jgi:hypothetical protein
MSIETKQTRNQVELLNALHVAREYESIPIQEHERWTVTLLHFTDSQNYKVFDKDKYCITWREGRNVLNHIYIKKHRKRSEVRTSKQTIQRCSERKIRGRRGVLE